MEAISIIDILPLHFEFYQFFFQITMKTVYILPEDKEYLDSRSDQRHGRYDADGYEHIVQLPVLMEIQDNLKRKAQR